MEIHHGERCCPGCRIFRYTNIRPKPLTVTFTDSSSGSITSRLWEYKLNASSTWTTFTLDGASKYSFANTGVYDVRLNVTGPGGSNTKTEWKYITVNDVAPVAGFSGTPTSGPKPLTVTFTDSSSGSITSRLWEYKLNASSTWTTFTLDGASKYSFANTGIYDVRLNVTGPGGSNTKTEWKYITVNDVAPVAGFSGTPTSGPKPLDGYLH